MPRFTLRDIFWLTLVVAMGVGRWVDSPSKSQRLEIWKQLATMLYNETGEATGQWKEWEVLGRPWPDSPPSTRATR